MAHTRLLNLSNLSSEPWILFSASIVLFALLPDALIEAPKRLHSKGGVSCQSIIRTRKRASPSHPSTTTTTTTQRQQHQHSAPEVHPRVSETLRGSSSEQSAASFLSLFLCRAPCVIFFALGVLCDAGSMTQQCTEWARPTGCPSPVQRPETARALTQQPPRWILTPDPLIHLARCAPDCCLGSIVSRSIAPISNATLSARLCVVNWPPERAMAGQGSDRFTLAAGCTHDTDIARPTSMEPRCENGHAIGLWESHVQDAGQSMSVSDCLGETARAGFTESRAESGIHSASAPRHTTHTRQPGTFTMSFTCRFLHHGSTSSHGEKHRYATAETAMMGLPTQLSNPAPTRDEAP